MAGRDTTAVRPDLMFAPNVGRAVLLGATLGFVVVGTLVTLLGLACGLVGGSAVAFGVFVGSWGGAGFGGTMGAVLAVSSVGTAGTDDAGGTGRP